MAFDLKYGRITAEHGDQAHGVVGAPLNASDEPCFVIRAQDAVGPVTVATWIEEADAAGASDETIASARVALDAMRAWQEAHPDRVKVPD